jgi:2-polyprenyl-6-methoxyphenol hydroxylase-like FAD-dependent oxidoreductase
VREVLIVGGGIAGLSLAGALARAGLAPEVVERAPAWAPLGAGIVLSVNAMAVLRRLGLAEAARARGLALAEAAIADERGRTLGRTDFRSLVARHGDTIAIHRADLHEVLLRGSGGVPLRMGTTVVAIEPAGERVRARLSDGSERECDLLVGADGLRSAVRALVFGANPPRYSGYTCWRFVTAVERPLPRAVEMWGRGQRLGLVPLADRRVYGFAVANAPPGTREPDAGSAARLRERFARFGGDAPAVLGSIERDEQVIHNDLEEVVQAPWWRGRVVLLGDAAHASTPNMGQGAAMALEDVAVLAELLVEKRPLDPTLAAWAARRMPRARWVQDQSRRIGRIGQLEHPLACALRNLVLRAVPDAAATRALARLAEQPL